MLYAIDAIQQATTQPSPSLLAVGKPLPSQRPTHHPPQAARKIHTAKFRSGKSSVMLVTDVAARGIDIPLLDNVINYDFPPKAKLFVHRAGRAARAGRSGTAYSFVTREDLPYLLDLLLFLGRPLHPAPCAVWLFF